MQNLFLSGHNLSRKEKISKQKTIQKQNKTKQKASHFAVETVGTSMEESPVGLREGARGSQSSLQGSSREQPQKKKKKKEKRKRKRAGWGPNCSHKGRGRGVQVFAAVENSEKQK